MKKVLILLMALLAITGCSLFDDEESENSIFGENEFERSILEFKGLHPQDSSVNNIQKVLNMGKRNMQIVYHNKFQLVEETTNEDMAKLLEIFDISAGKLLFSETEQSFLVLIEEDGAKECKKAFFDLNELNKLKDEVNKELSSFDMTIDYSFRTTVNGSNTLIFSINGEKGGQFENYNGYMMSMLEDDEKQVLIFGLAPKQDNKRLDIEKMVSTFYFY